LALTHRAPQWDIRVASGGVRMRARPLTLFGLAIGLLTVSAPIFAHHGAAAYETTKLTTLQGTITGFQFMNPHSEIFFDVKDTTGKVEKWTAEAASLVSMSRLGWTKSTLRPGDQITITGNRAKNGSNTMRLRKVALPNGKEFIVERGEDYADQ
jgi:hypothetical protein